MISNVLKIGAVLVAAGAAYYAGRLKGQLDILEEIVENKNHILIIAIDDKHRETIKEIADIETELNNESVTNIETSWTNLSQEEKAEKKSSLEKALKEKNDLLVCLQDLLKMHEGN